MTAVRPLAPPGHIAAGWLAIAVVFAVHEYASSRADGHAVPPALAAYWSASEWLLWGLLTPAVFALVARVPIASGRGLRSLAALAVAGGLITLTHIVLQSMLDAVVTGVLASEFVSIRSWLSGYQASGPADLAYLIPRKFGFGYTVFWALVAVGMMLNYYRLSIDRATAAVRLERELAEARLAAVRQQLHPHFLFNSLNGIAELIHERPERAERMLSYLSDLLRRAIRTDATTRVPLNQELGFVRRYVALQRARYGDKLRVELDVPRELRAWAVPPHILQPVIENAIQHGGPAVGHVGAIELTARAAGSCLELLVSDRGPGLTHTPPVEGTGLRSTRARLEAAFARQYTLELRARPGGGTTCRIEIPATS